MLHSGVSVQNYKNKLFSALRNFCFSFMIKRGTEEDNYRMRRNTLVTLYFLAFLLLPTPSKLLLNYVTNDQESHFWQFLIWRSDWPWRIWNLACCFFEKEKFFTREGGQEGSISKIFFSCSRWFEIHFIQWNIFMFRWGPPGGFLSPPQEQQS